MKLQDLLHYNKITVQCHEAPDADALASAYGVIWYLRKHRKDARVIYSNSGTNRKLIQKSDLKCMIKDLKLEIEYVTALEDTPDLLLFVDCQPGENNVPLFGMPQNGQNCGSRIDFQSEETVLKIFGARAVAVIDHHKIREPGQLPPLQEIRQSYGSCSTILWDMLVESGEDPCQDQNLATALYYGLYTDTSELQELRHAKDSDLLGSLGPDYRNEKMLSHWKTCNLSLSEMKSAGEALSRYDYDEDNRFAIMEMRSEDGCYLDQNLLGIIGDLLMRVDKIDTCVSFCEQATCFRVSVRTCTSEVLATDIIRFITAGLGDGGGHRQKTAGQLYKEGLSKAFEAWCGFRPKTEEDLRIAARQLLHDRMKAYYNSFDVFYSQRVETSQKIGLDSMELYEKRTDGSPIGYIHVVSEQLYEPGTVLTIRSLEGDMVETVSENTYLMFGVDGEPYTNSKEAFLAQYEDSDEHYIFSGEYRPHITSARSAGDTEQKPLDEEDLLAHIHACKPKPGYRVFARRLVRRAKIFSPRRKDYLLGEPGDWLVAKAENTSHIHIVKAESFPKLYTKDLKK